MTGVWYGDPASIRGSVAQMRQIATEIAELAGTLDRADESAEVRGPYADRLRDSVLQSHADALRLSVELIDQAISLARAANRIEEQIAASTATGL
jgi:hypothetical protein